MNSANPAQLQVRQLAVDAETAEHYAVLFSPAQRGRPAPTNDLWIAASAMQHGYALFSFDKHFAEMENLIWEVRWKTSCREDQRTIVGFTQPMLAASY